MHLQHIIKIENGGYLHKMNKYSEKKNLKATAIIEISILCKSNLTEMRLRQTFFVCSQK